MLRYRRLVGARLSKLDSIFCRVQGGALISQRGYGVKRTTAGTARVWAPLTCGAGPNHTLSSLLQPQLSILVSIW